MKGEKLERRERCGERECGLEKERMCVCVWEREREGGVTSYGHDDMSNHLVGVVDLLKMLL